MPFTFFSHQAPVVPIKIAWPHLFSGQATSIIITIPINERVKRESDGAPVRLPAIHLESRDGRY